jgi:hypothetical protein
MVGLAKKLAPRFSFQQFIPKGDEKNKGVK